VQLVVAVVPGLLLTYRVGVIVGTMAIGPLRSLSARVIVTEAVDRPEGVPENCFVGLLALGLVGTLLAGVGVDVASNTGLVGTLSGVVGGLPEQFLGRGKLQRFTAWEAPLAISRTPFAVLVVAAFVGSISI
jgi:hypothetical protein